MAMYCSLWSSLVSRGSLDLHGRVLGCHMTLTYFDDLYHMICYMSCTHSNSPNYRLPDMAMYYSLLSSLLSRGSLDLRRRVLDCHMTLTFSYDLHRRICCMRRTHSTRPNCRLQENRCHTSPYTPSPCIPCTCCFGSSLYLPIPCNWTCCLYM